MADADLERRVRILEGKMDELRDVPSRLMAVELQIVQLRGEMHSGFSAIQTQMHALNDQTRTEMVRLNAETREEMVRLNDETRTHMRALHEDVIARIALLHDGFLGPTRDRRRPPKKRH